MFVRSLFFTSVVISSLEEKLEPNTRVLLCVPRVSHGSRALTSYRSGQSAGAQLCSG